MSRPAKHLARSSTRSRTTHEGPSNTVGALLVEFDRCATTEDRARTGAKLATFGVRDARIRAALVRMLEDDPLNAAAYLSAYGDRTAVADLSRALDRLLADPIADCDICAAEHLMAIVTALEMLGGTPTKDQVSRMTRVLDRAAEQWVPLENHCASKQREPLH
jgi:hypothetical protein